MKCSCKIMKICQLKLTEIPQINISQLLELISNVLKLRETNLYFDYLNFFLLIFFLSAF